MGKTIEKIALNNDDTIVLKTDSHEDLENNLDLLKTADVAIEFSMPEAAFKNVTCCINHQIPVVSGTTGWLDDYQSAKTLCVQKNSAMLVASNFSIGVNIFFEVNRFLAKRMNSHLDYKVAIEEIHHTQKIDQPSGTAITLAEGAIEMLAHKSNGINEKAEKDEDLTIISKRIENVPGTHNITYTSDIDTIELIHTAHSREGFAKGALMAAKWLKDKKGVFGMRDMLGL